MTSRARAFTFTINNDRFSDLELLLDAIFKYLCFGFEIGKQGTRHIQGYIYFDNPKRYNEVKKIMPRAHIEISKGTAKENAIYTSKDDDWYEFGDRPSQGKAKWEQIEDVMQDPTINPHVYNQYNKMYRQITMSKKKEHERKLYIIEESKKYEYAKKFDTVLFDTTCETYDGEKVIIVPCYGDSFVLNWINGFPNKIKRGYELICVDPEYVFITYNDLKEKNYLIKKYLDNIEYDEIL